MAYPDRQCFEADVNAFYDRLSEIRVAPPQQILDSLNSLLLGGDHYTDPTLEALWQRIVANPAFADYSVNFLNRCCYILINHWTMQRKAKGGADDLVRLLQRVAVNESTRTLPWASALGVFFSSSEFTMLKELTKVAEIKSRPEGYEQQSLNNFIHRYPCLYTSYFTRFNRGAAGRRSAQVMRQKREQAFELKLLRHTRHMGKAQTQGIQIDPTENPTLLSGERLKVAVHEFSGARASHDYRQSAEQCTRRIQQVRSNRLMKEQIQTYLVHSLDTYGQASSDSFQSSSYRFGGWLNHQLKAMRVELDGRQPNTAAVAHTCGALLNSVLAVPTDINGLDNHTRFIDLTSNLGATYTMGLILKVILLCSHPESNMTALQNAVNNRFVRLFEHYEKMPSQEDVSSVSWLLECMDNYMVASSIQFGDTPPSMWRSMLQT